MAEARGEGPPPPIQQGYDQRSNARRRYRLEKGDHVRVRLTNGAEREATIAIRIEHGQEADMGRRYTTSAAIPYADFGDGTRAELDAVEIHYERERDPTANELDQEVPADG
jgi:hypothetical protein